MRLYSGRVLPDQGGEAECGLLHAGGDVFFGVNHLQCLLRAIRDAGRFFKSQASITLGGDLQLFARITLSTALFLVLGLWIKREILFHRETVFKDRDHLQGAERAGEQACFAADAETFIDRDDIVFLENSENRAGCGTRRVFAMPALKRHRSLRGPNKIESRLDGVLHAANGERRLLS